MKLALVMIVLLAQEKTKLEVRAKKGDKIRVEAVDTLDGTWTLRGQKDVQEQHDKLQIKFTDEVLEVNGTWPSSVRRMIDEWTEGSQAKPGKGKTLTIKSKEGKTTIEGATLDSSDRRKMRLTNVFLQSLPKSETAVGGTWSVPEKDLLLDFNDESDTEAPITLTSAKATGTFKKLSAGRATVVYDFEAAGDVSGGSKIAVKVAITIEIDTKTARPTGIRNEGTLAITGDGVEGKLAVKSQVDYK